MRWTCREGRAVGPHVDGKDVVAVSKEQLPPVAAPDWFVAALDRHAPAIARPRIRTNVDFISAGVVRCVRDRAPARRKGGHVLDEGRLGKPGYRLSRAHRQELDVIT